MVIIRYVVKRQYAVLPHGFFANRRVFRTLADIFSLNSRFASELDLE